MKTATVDDVMSWKPCWEAEDGSIDVERIEECFGDRTEVTALDILRMTDVSSEDRLWAVLRPAMLSERIFGEWTWRVGYSALLGVAWAGIEVDDRSAHAVMTRRAWCRGEASDEDLASAASTARAAAWDAASGTATWDAAWDAAWAAGDAAGGAAWDAARAAASGAAASGTATWDAAWGAQVECLIWCIGRYEND